MFLTEILLNSLLADALDILAVLFISAACTHLMLLANSANNNRKKPTRHPEMNREIEDMLTCPISRDFMSDPVTLAQSQQTCDRANHSVGGFPRIQ